MTPCTIRYCRFNVRNGLNILENEFNPNVALEYGFMRALGKPVLLLKEKRMAPRADILGTLWEEFDMVEGIERTIRDAINRWAHDCGMSLPVVASIADPSNGNE